MGFLTGKRILITGLLSKHSIAYGIAKACHREGAQLAFTYQNERFLDRINKFSAEFDSKLVYLCDVAWAGGNQLSSLVRRRARFRFPPLALTPVTVGSYHLHATLANSCPLPCQDGRLSPRTLPSRSGACHLRALFSGRAVPAKVVTALASPPLPYIEKGACLKAAGQTPFSDGC